MTSNTQTRGTVVRSTGAEEEEEEEEDDDEDDEEEEEKPPERQDINRNLQRVLVVPGTLAYSTMIGIIMLIAIHTANPRKHMLPHSFCIQYCLLRTPSDIFCS